MNIKFLSKNRSLYIKRLKYKYEIKLILLKRIYTIKFPIVVPTGIKKFIVLKIKNNFSRTINIKVETLNKKNYIKLPILFIKKRSFINFIIIWHPSEEMTLFEILKIKWNKNITNVKIKAYSYNPTKFINNEFLNTLNLRKENKPKEQKTKLCSTNFFKSTNSSSNLKKNSKQGKKYVQKKGIFYIIKKTFSKNTFFYLRDKLSINHKNNKESKDSLLLIHTLGLKTNKQNIQKQSSIYISHVSDLKNSLNVATNLLYKYLTLGKSIIIFELEEFQLRKKPLIFFKRGTQITRQYIYEEKIIDLNLRIIIQIFFKKIKKITVRLRGKKKNISKNKKCSFKVEIKNIFLSILKI